MKHQSVPELFSNFPSKIASLAWTGPEYRAGCGGWNAYIPVVPPRILEEPFCVHCGPVDVVDLL